MSMLLCSSQSIGCSPPHRHCLQWLVQFCLKGVLLLVLLLLLPRGTIARVRHGQGSELGSVATGLGHAVVLSLMPLPEQSPLGWSHCCCIPSQLTA